MTIEERLSAIERELEHQREMAKLRAIADDLAVTRVERVEGQLGETKKVLPRLQAAMKELEEASIVTSHLQAKQGGVIKSYGEWLEELTRAGLKTEEQFRETDKRRAADRAEDRQRGQELDKRIADLVSAIAEMLRKNGK